MTKTIAPTVTIERRAHVLMIGINRPFNENRVDPATFHLLGKAYHDYEQDPYLRAAVLFGHGENFCMGLDVDAFAPVLMAGPFDLAPPVAINPTQTSSRRLTKPIVGVAHGNTFFLGHELLLATDVRVAATGTVFWQGENSRALFPGGGVTIRFTREAGWAQAMRYMLTGDTWGPDEALRMGLIADTAPTAEAALALGFELATKIAACAPLSTMASLRSAHQAVDEAEAKAFAGLQPTFETIIKAQDFQERVRALKEGRKPIYQGR